jgi:hypothetical protein
MFNPAAGGMSITIRMNRIRNGTYRKRGMIGRWPATGIPVMLTPCREGFIWMIWCANR